MNTLKVGWYQAFLMLAVLMLSVLLPFGGCADGTPAPLSGTWYEAEDASLEQVQALVDIAQEGCFPQYSGTGFVGNFSVRNENPCALTFTVDIPADQWYTVTILAFSPYDQKHTRLLIDAWDGIPQDVVIPHAEAFMPVSLPVKLSKGQHTLRLEAGEGYFFVDAMILNVQAPIEIAHEATPLVNPNATEAAVAVKKYLDDSYGHVVLSGQYAEGLDAPEIKAIYAQTGKYPAIMGFDFLYCGKTAEENAKTGYNTTQLAIDWWRSGGLVTFSWHWLAPKDNDFTQHPWNKTFETDGTLFDLKKALSGEDAQGYALLLADIDTVARQLAILQQAGVPVLWRPLHEASGGWFWWGNAGAQAYKTLWNLMYDRMVNHHGLNNLIWVWNGEHNGIDPLDAWYPGDDTVDIIGEDIYPARQDYSPHIARFTLAQAYTDEEKIITLSETGVIPDPDEMLQSGAMWAWFATWYREYVVQMSSSYSTEVYSEEYTQAEMLRKVYAHKAVITRDELPAFEIKRASTWIYVAAYSCIFLLFFTRTIIAMLKRWVRSRRERAR